MKVRLVFGWIIAVPTAALFIAAVITGAIGAAVETAVVLALSVIMITSALHSLKLKTPSAAKQLTGAKTVKSNNGYVFEVSCRIVSPTIRLIVREYEGYYLEMTKAGTFEVTLKSISASGALHLRDFYDGTFASLISKGEYALYHRDLPTSNEDLIITRVDLYDSVSIVDGSHSSSGPDAPVSPGQTVIFSGKIGEKGGSRLLGGLPESQFQRAAAMVNELSYVLYLNSYKQGLDSGFGPLEISIP